MKTPNFVRTTCEYCAWYFEYDASQVVSGVNDTMPCPHCGIEITLPTIPQNKVFICGLALPRLPRKAVPIIWCLLAALVFGLAAHVIESRKPYNKGWRVGYDQAFINLGVKDGTKHDASYVYTIQGKYTGRNHCQEFIDGYEAGYSAGLKNAAYLAQRVIEIHERYDGSFH